ncbi:hypothetical protein [Nocardia sp. A7]|uniref:hypothetical protein n=1 Tax=Nocardia sp. A7 TaxID=2789274 RepID=UPI003978B590
MVRVLRGNHQGLAIVVVGLALSAVAGCSGGVIDRGGEPMVMSDSPELVAEATDFGDWSLPAEGKVLLVRREKPEDLRYNLVLETSPSGLAWMLEHSHYTAPFKKWMPVSPVETIAGPPLATSPNLQKAQDFFTSPEGDAMIRDVLVDERSPELRIIHIEFRGQ